MNRIQIHSKNLEGNKSLLWASKIFFALTLFALLGLPNTARAYEWDRKALEEAGNMDFPKQETSTSFSSYQPKSKSYIFGIKMNFEVNTIWSKPKNKLKSEQLINRYFSEYELLNEFPLEPEVSVGGKAAKLLEIRF
jgi:hypothetical protein